MVSPSSTGELGCQSPLTLPLVWVPLLASAPITSIPLKSEKTHIPTKIYLMPQPLLPTAEPQSNSSSQLLREAIKPIGHFFFLFPHRSAVINGLINTHDIQFPLLCMSSLGCWGFAATSPVMGVEKGLSGSWWEPPAGGRPSGPGFLPKLQSSPPPGVSNTFHSLLCSRSGLFSLPRLLQPRQNPGATSPPYFTPNDFPVF